MTGWLGITQHQRGVSNLCLKYTLSFSSAPIAYWLISSVYSATAGFAAMFLILAVGMLTAVSAALLIPDLSTQEYKTEEEQAIESL